MDPRLDGGKAGGQPPAQPVQGTVVPMGEGWAPGVVPVAVGAHHRGGRWLAAAAVVLTVAAITAAGAFWLSGAAGQRSLTATAAPKDTVAFMELRLDLPGDQHARLADFMTHFPGFQDRAQFNTALSELLDRVTGSASADLTYSSALKPWMEGEASVALLDLGGTADATGAVSSSTPAPRPTPIVCIVTPSPVEPPVLPSLEAPTFELAPSGEPASTGEAVSPEPSVEPSSEPTLAEPTYPPCDGPEPSPIGSIDQQTSLPLVPNAVAIFRLKDRATAESWMAAEVTRLGYTTISQGYAGTSLYTFGPNGAYSYALTDQNLLVGTVEGVKASLDTRSNGSLADNANYQAAMRSLPGDSLARFYVDERAVASAEVASYNAAVAAENRWLASEPSASLLPTLGISVQDYPAWVAGSVRAESDRMVVTETRPRTKDLGIGNHSSRLASMLPGSTVAVFEAHSVGKLVAAEVASLERQPGVVSAAALQSVKDVLNRIGGVDWVGDGAGVVTKDGSTYGGGVVVEATDAATAKAKLALIINLATLASSSFHVTSRDETYKGIDITVISVPAEATGVALEAAGIHLGTGGMPLEIAVAAKDNLIMAGYGDAFVKAVIDTAPSNALSSQEDYKKVMAAAGASNEASFYVNVPAIEDTVGQALWSSRWTSDYKPYFDHVGGIGGAEIDGDTVILRLVITAR